MAKITAPVKGFKGKVAGVTFEDGVGETTDRNALAYFRRKGYGIGGSQPTGTGAGKDGPEPADPREVSSVQVGEPLRDGAVDPREGDFLGPKNAGEANPHGPEVVNPELHGSQGVRPVKGGEVHVDDPEVQDEAETEHAAQATDGTPVPGSEPVEQPAGNASRDAWAEYARSQGAPESELAQDGSGLGRDELREKYGKAEA